MSRLQPNRRRALAGFTLIELLVVIVIVGILVAIGVPAYLKYTAAANDRDAQAALRVAYKAAVAGDSEVNTAKFPIATTIVADISADEPAASVARGDCIGAIGAAPTKQVLVDPASTTSQVLLCTRSASGAVWKLTGPLTGNPTVSDGSLIPFSFSGSEMTATVRAAGLQGDGAPVSDSSTGVWEATTNLNSNGGFESNTGGWTSLGGGATLTQDNSTAKFGASSMKVVVPSGFDGARRVMAIAANTTYTYSVWLKGPAAGLQVKLDDNGAGGSQITAASPGSSWTRYTATITSGAAASTANLYVIGAGPFTVWMDGAQLEQKPVATPYVETNGATQSRGAANLTLPASVVTETQGWVAVRMRVGFGYTNPPALWGTSGAIFTIAGLGGSSARYVFGHITQTGQAGMQIRSDDGTYQTAVDPATPTFAAGDILTIVFAWTPTQVKVSTNGDVFSAAGRTKDATNLDPIMYIGSGFGSRWIDSDYLWFATGTGTLSSADAATINSWGSNDPKRSSFPASAQATMVWDGNSSSGSLK